MNGKRVNVLWLPIIFAVGAVAAFLALTLEGQEQATPIRIEPAPAETFTVPPMPTATMGPLRVYVSGAVVSPDVYELPQGSIAADAVALAGGFTPDAAPELVNLALSLVDGMHIHVPTALVTGADAPPVFSVPAQAITGGSGESAFLVNINTASAPELESLPGIGPATAQNIIEYRQSHGLFQEIEDIMNVAGIGEAKFDALRDLITVQ